MYLCSIFVQKIKRKSSQNWVCLVWKMFPHLGGVFLSYLELHSVHIRQNPTFSKFCRSEGWSERDMVSLRMMGWGLVLLENSSVAAAAVAVTWGWTPKIGFWSPKHITHVIFSRCIFSKILLKNVQTHLLDLIYYIWDFHTFLVKMHGHRSAGPTEEPYVAQGIEPPGSCTRKRKQHMSSIPWATVGPALLWPCIFTRRVWKSHI